MINFQTVSLHLAMEMLRAHIGYALGETSRSRAAVVDGARRSIIKNNFDYVARVCAELLLDSADKRVQRLEMLFQQQVIYYEQIANELTTLLEAIEDDLKYEYFYHYPRHKAVLLLRAQGDWAATVQSFPSVKEEIDLAVDCYACDHNTACVYHLMRILEHGLRELAAAVNLTFDVQQWHTIIEQIEAEIRAIGQSWKLSPIKTAWMQFYSEAAKEFMYFKDGWRNHVAHSRVSYDSPRALSILDHVRQFMNHLSSRLSE